MYTCITIIKEKVPARGPPKHTVSLVIDAFEEQPRIMAIPCNGSFAWTTLTNNSKKDCSCLVLGFLLAELCLLGAQIEIFHLNYKFKHQPTCIVGILGRYLIL